MLRLILAVAFREQTTSAAKNNCKSDGFASSSSQLLTVSRGLCPLSTSCHCNADRADGFAKADCEEKMETTSRPAPPAPATAAPDWRGILDRLAARHSCRDFDGSAIDPETLADIVRDGIEAPSSCNQQNWHFIIVTDPQKMRRAHKISGGNHHFSECSALIYLCFQKGWTHGNFSIVQSVAGATYHMMLSAHLRGFQCIWNAGIGDKEQLCDMLGLPPIFELQGTLAIGRAKPTAPTMKAPRRPFDEVHSWERFERPERSRYPVKPANAAATRSSQPQAIRSFAFATTTTPSPSGTPPDGVGTNSAIFAAIPSGRSRP
jgi:nitroreductase